jgi:hypothetical protein
VTVDDSDVVDGAVDDMTQEDVHNDGIDDVDVCDSEHVEDIMDAVLPV